MNKKYKIDSNIIKNYISAINSNNGTTNQIKDNKFILKMKEEINKISNSYPNEKVKLSTNVIKQIMEKNNGIITSRMIDSLDISREYLSILKRNKEIEQISRGIYQSPNIFEDSFYSFQSKYKKAIYSHMNALYFYGLTEEVPYNYTVSVSQCYHMNTVNEKCNVFYVSNDLLELGLCEAITPYGNKVRTYDIERSICDIIRSKNRMDLEQVKKTIKQYMNSKDKNITKLIEYSKKLNINNKLNEILEVYNDK